MASRATLVRGARNRKTGRKNKKTPAIAGRGRRFRFVICVEAGEYEGVDLDLARIYEALPTDKIDRENGFVRVIDNSGEDYLFPSKWFIEVKLPKPAKEAVVRARLA